LQRALSTPLLSQYRRCVCVPSTLVMLSRKTSLLVSAYGNLHSFHGASGSSTSSCQRREGTRQQHERRCGRRRYATIAGDGREDQQDHIAPDVPKEKAQPSHQWPVPVSGQQHPTPYQIFAMKSNARYSKADFYQLVKLYHPDLHSSPTIAHQLKTERYRLIVAAHTILSDPIKRSAYDRFGAGWNGRSEFGMQSGTPHPGPGPFSHSWQSGGQGEGNTDPIWQNATWEDWERFYAWRARKASGATASGADDPQSPLYVRNSHFIVVVILLAFAGSSANYSRAQGAGQYLVEQRDLVHDRSAKDLRKVRQDMAGLSGKEERMQWFLRQREATMGTLSVEEVEVLRGERAGRILPEPEVCRSEGVRGKEP